jgi:hypothetical protein
VRRVDGRRIIGPITPQTTVADSCTACKSAGQRDGLPRSGLRPYFQGRIKERLVPEVGYGLALEGASAAALVKSFQTK